MAEYKYLFFDLDHTLWDFETNSIYTLQDLYNHVLLQEKGVQSFEEFKKIYHEINDTMWAKFRNGEINREDLRWKRMWQTLLHFDIYNVDLAKEMSEKYLEILPTKTHVFPYALDILHYCKSKNLEIHLITNGFEATQLQKLKNAKMDIYFDKIITSEKALTMKPHRGIFEYAFAETGAKSYNSIMIGDALDIDILGAAQVKMAQIYFNPKKEKHTSKPTHEIHCLSEIKNII